MSFFHNIQQDFNNISRTFHVPPPSRPPVISIQPIHQPFKQPPIIPPSHFIPMPIPQPLKPILDPIINPILHQITPPHTVAQPIIQPIAQRLQQPPQTQEPTKPSTQSTFSNFLESDSSYILYGLAGLGIIIFVFNKIYITKNDKYRKTEKRKTCPKMEKVA